MTSYRQILRSSSIIGGASAVNIGLSILRVKVAALLLGPAGIGLIGLYNNVMTTIGTVAGMGIGTSGTRLVARAVGHNDQTALNETGWALRYLAASLAVTGAIAIWFLRDVIATVVFADASLAQNVGLLGVGVFFAVAAGSQAALLAGMRRIGDQARLSVYCALVSTVVAVLAIYFLGERGILVFVVISPVATWAYGWYYVRKLPRLQFPENSAGPVMAASRDILKLGFAFMISGLALVLTQLFVRALLMNRLGADALGMFHAVWAISMTYLSFVLGAMSRDYYPRLTAAIDDQPLARRLVNEQSEVALLLSGPILILMMGCAPWVIALLYSSEFEGAVEVFRWQLLGDVLKVASWPMGFILQAMGKSRIFMTVEIGVLIIFAIAVSALLKPHGLLATGMGFLIMYCVYLPLVVYFAKQLIGYRPAPMVIALFLSLLAAIAAVWSLVTFNQHLGAFLSIALAIVMSVFAYVRLRTALINSDSTERIPADET